MKCAYGWKGDVEGLSWIQTIILSAVQGFTAFFPFSSTGFRMILCQLLGLPLDGSGLELLEGLLYLSCLFPILLVFRKEFRAALGGGENRSQRKPEGRKHRNGLLRRFALLVFAGALPLLLVLPAQGLLASWRGSLLFAACFMVLNGLLLFSCERIAHGTRKVRAATMADSLLMGSAQAISAVPGLSRTGLTVLVGIAQGMDESTSVAFSFLLGIPALLLAATSKLIEALRLGHTAFRPQYLAGMVLTAFCGYFALRLLRFVARKNAFGSLAYGSWGAGLLAFILYLTC